MNKSCNKNLLKSLKLIEDLKSIAHKGLSESEDDNCILLYGIINDSCYRIKTEIEKEISRHKHSGKWI